MSRVTDARFTVDRLWPDPAAGLDLDEALRGFTPAGAAGPHRGCDEHGHQPGRPGAAGRDRGGSLGPGRPTPHAPLSRGLRRGGERGRDPAQDGLLVVPSGRPRRRTEGRRPQRAATCRGDCREQPWCRSTAAGSASTSSACSWSAAALRTRSPGRRRCPTAPTCWSRPRIEPEPRWVLEQLAARGIGSLLLEGGPTLNSAFLVAGCLDEVYWTVGGRVLAAEGLPMFATPPSGSPFAVTPREARLLSVLRSGDELFLRYRFDPAG